MRSHPFACLSLGLVLAGCATTPLEQRDWAKIETTHYEIWSSLDTEASARLAVELERFRAGVEFIWGSAFPAVRTRVYAFDDRGLGRPFALRGQRSYLLPRQRGDLIVLRTGDGWEGDARAPLKLAYARRLIWNATPTPLPPWLEEGLAQVASTLEIRGNGATVGMLQSPHVRALRDSQWVPFTRLLAASDWSSGSSLERALFEAESWALCHYLAFHESRRNQFRAALTRFRAALREGIPPAEAARSAFGDEGELQSEVWDHVRAAELASLTVRIPWVGPKPATHPVLRREILEQLGLLSLAIDENEQAKRFFERALEDDARSPLALAGLGDALAVDGDRDEADARYQAALEAAPDDPLVHLGWANLLRARAGESAESAQQAELASRARDHYQRSIDLDRVLAEPHAGLAETYLGDGEDPAIGVAHARDARSLLPGDPEIRLLHARLALARGDRATALAEATYLKTRARSESDLDVARSLLERIDSRTAR